MLCVAYLQPDLFRHFQGGAVTYLSLRDFLDVATKTRKPRATKVRQIRYADPYSPVTDFYKPPRQGIVGIHKAGKSRVALGALLQGIGDKRKLANHPLAINGYDAWWGARQLKWFEPPKGKYPKYGFEVSVNPELGLEINGSPHVIKLYLNTIPLSAERAALIGALMTHVVGSGAPTVILSSLDTRRSALMPAPVQSAALMATVDSVLADIAVIWPTV